MSEHSHIAICVLIILVYIFSMKRLHLDICCNCFPSFWKFSLSILPFWQSYIQFVLSEVFILIGHSWSLQMNGNSRLVEQVYRLILETFDDYGRTDRGGIWWCDDVLSRHHRFSQHILCLYFLRPSLTRRIWNLFCLVEYISIRHRFHSNRCPSTTLFLFSSQGRLLWIYKFCLCTWKEM